MVEKIFKTLAIFLFGLSSLNCGDNYNPAEISSSTVSDETSLVTTPTESNLLFCNCQLEEICFENECSHFRALVYEIRILEYENNNSPCRNYEYDALLDNKLIYTSSISKCGSKWTNDYFVMHGDEILELRIWTLGNFNKREFGKQLCNWNEEYKTCTQLPFKFFDTDQYVINYKEEFVKFSVKPIGNLNVEL